jgi:hypothetical protein
MPNTEGRADVVLRPFTGDDIAPLGALFAVSRASMQLFDDPYTVGEHTAYIAGLSVGCQIVVAERDSALAGFLSQTDGLISHLYVHPGHQIAA